MVMAFSVTALPSQANDRKRQKTMTKPIRSGQQRTHLGPARHLPQRVDRAAHVIEAVLTDHPRAETAALILADEPTASLDPHAKREVETLMADFAAGQGQPLTLIWASHNLGQVKRLATRVVYLEGGQVLADLPVGDFFDATQLAVHSPAAHAFVQGEM